tara:strand:- start:1836 stop:1979 length:144 start_codon:yes stop_codon:yes gene_type:complete
MSNKRVKLKEKGKKYFEKGREKGGPAKLKSILFLESFINYRGETQNP